jgi:hypothetical protein
VLTPGANTDEIDDSVKGAVAGRESREGES